MPPSLQKLKSLIEETKDLSQDLKFENNIMRKLSLIKTIQENIGKMQDLKPTEEEIKQLDNADEIAKELLDEISDQTFLTDLESEIEGILKTVKSGDLMRAIKK